MNEYRIRIAGTSAKRLALGLILAVAFAAMVFYPWKNFGVHPLWFSSLPNWFGWVVLLILIWTAAWIALLQEVGKS